MHLIDISIVIAYVIICLIIGLIKARPVNTAAKFSVLYKQIPNSMLICTMFASSIGAGSIFGASERIYIHGPLLVLFTLIQPAYWWISSKIFAPRIAEFSDCITISQIMNKLYGKPGKWISAISTIITSLGIIAAQAMAVGYLLNYFFQLDVLHGIYLTYSILLIYTATGGIGSVVATETFKFSVIIFVLPVSYIISIIYFKERFLLPDYNMYFSSRNYFPNELFNLCGYLFFFLLPSCDCALIQRCLMAKDSKQLKNVMHSVALISLAFAISLNLIVYLVTTTTTLVKPNEIIFFYISHYLPIGMKGMLYTIFDKVVLLIFCYYRAL